jgi:hypothetical protein
MKKITLSNEFHSTEATVIPQLIADGRFKGYYKISRKVAMRLRNELCGMSDCSCGGNFGERGGNRLDVCNEDSERNYIIDMSTSHVA